MPLNKKTTYGSWYKQLYATELQKVIVYKREDDQREGTVTPRTVYNVRRRQISKTGQPIAGDFGSNQRTTWVFPQYELDKAGINYLNPLDRIYDPIEGITWMPEADTNIQVKLFRNMTDVDCKRTDPVR